MMELRVLRYFLAVVREESITAAAQALHITQPTLSRQLMDLEQEVGAPLLIRGARSQKIALTEKGMLLRRRAEEMIELADKTQEELARDDAGVGGEVALGGGETDGMRLLARLAKQLQADYPRLHYRLYSGNAEDVKERLEKGLLDFGVFVEPTDLHKYERLRLPCIDRWGLLVRRDSPLAAKSGIRPEDLCGVPLMLSQQRLLSDEVSPWLGCNADHLNIVATYNLIYTAALMVEEGVGCALCLDKLVYTCGDRPLRFVPLEPPLSAYLSVAWKKYQPMSKAAELFLARLQALCAAV